MLNKTNKLPVALAISVLLNAFLLGYILSGPMSPHTRSFPDHPEFAINMDNDMPPPPMFDQGEGRRGDKGPNGPEDHIARLFEEKARALPTETRNKVMDIIGKYKEESKTEQDISQIFDNLQTALTADPLDRQQIIDLHKSMRQSDLANKDRMEQMVLDIAQTLSPKERKDFFRMGPPPHNEDGFRKQKK